MTQRNRDTSWRRDKLGMGVWPHQGKVSIQGWAQSPVDRRWDGVSMDKTLGSYAKIAVLKALDDAGLRPDQVDGLISCPENMAGGNGGSSAVWAPRPYFEAPYDSEDGITVVSGKWLSKFMPELTNLTYIPDEVPAIGEGMGFAAQAVADGKCHTAVYTYAGNNLEGRYRRGGENLDDYAKGEGQWSRPWGNHGGNDFSNTIAIQQYCTKYGTKWEDFLGPFVVNQHRNGLMNEWSFYTLHEPYQLTIEDYVNSRPIIWPLRIWDCDRPVNTVGAFVFTTADRAKDMKQKPVYVMNHTGGSYPGRRSSHEVMDDLRLSAGLAAKMMWEGTGWSPKDVDVFNPYDGYASMTPFFLEAFEWHGVGEGDAHELFKGDISVEGPNPFCSGGGNLGNGRTRTAMYIDSIEQLRGTAGKRQVHTKAETAVCAFAPMGSLAYLALSNVPS